jgi:F-type H+-transporting ATPase subunit delta
MTGTEKQIAYANDIKDNAIRNLQNNIERMGDELNLVAVDVTTAVELDDYLRDLIKKKASSELGKDIVLNEHVDKSILGGIIMSTKDERIDASLLTLVEKTREALKK